MRNLDGRQLDEMNLEEKWEVLASKWNCPTTLFPFVDSKLIEVNTGPDRTTKLTVELRPGLFFENTHHTPKALASFFALRVDGVTLSAVPENARRLVIALEGVTLA